MLTIYKASAGSGKTFTLAYEYIRLLLGHYDQDNDRWVLNRNPRRSHSKILAITFTNKATDEMKRRIIHELAVLAGEEPGWTKASDYEQRLIDLFHCSAEELRNAAQRALHAILFDYNYFNVSTIDAFFQSILRTFAREAELNGGYELQLDTKEMMRYGVQELFASVNRDAHATGSDRVSYRQLIDIITTYLLKQLKEGKTLSVFNHTDYAQENIVKQIYDLNNEKLALHTGNMMAYLRNAQLLEQFETTLSQERERMKGDAQAAAKRALLLVESTPLGKGKVSQHPLNALEKIADWSIVNCKTRPSSPSKVRGNIDAAYTSDANKFRAKNPTPELDQAILDAFSTYLDRIGIITIIDKTLGNMFLLKLIARVFDIVERYRIDNNTLLLSDTGKLLRSIIGDSDAPFVYERMGTWFQHYLIDEFQDTSMMQWQNLNPLLIESLSHGHNNLVIGDEKQCIYRFRNSDPTLLQNKVEHDVSTITEVEVMGDHPEQNTNWRSSADVVRFNNALYSAMAALPKLQFTQDIYAHVEQRVAPKNASRSGYIKVSAFVEEKKKDADTVDDAATEADAKNSWLDTLCHNICRQLEAGYRPCDIAVLVRKNDEGQKVINYLMDQQRLDPDFPQFDIISDDLMKISSAPAVQLIVSVMRSFTYPVPKVDHTKEQRLRNSSELVVMANRYIYNLSCGSDEKASMAEAIEYMEDEGWKDTSENKTPTTPDLTSLTEFLIELYLTDETRASQNAYLSAFQDLVSEFSNNRLNDMTSFLEWWEESGSKKTMGAPVNDNAIRVMTIHKSKGLEFPCVHVPYVNGETTGGSKDLEWFATVTPDGKHLLPTFPSEIVPPLLPFSPSAWMQDTPLEGPWRQLMQEQVIDEMNVLYVATTRAIDELCIGIKSDGNGDMNIGKLMLNGLKAAYGWDAKSAEPLEIGSPTTPREQEVKPHTAIEPTAADTMAPYYAHERPELLKATVVDDIDTDDMRLPRVRGTVMHLAMSDIATPDDITPALHGLVRKGKLPAASVEEADCVIRESLAAPEVARWFDPTLTVRLLRERTITDERGEHLRPDRVVWTTDGHVDIIDYKFGDPNLGDYRKKMHKYINAFASLGYTGIRGYIWSLDSGEVVEVDA